jgi:hypothetical protein
VKDDEVIENAKKNKSLHTQLRTATRIQKKKKKKNCISTHTTTQADTNREGKKKKKNVPIDPSKQVTKCVRLSFITLLPR